MYKTLEVQTFSGTQTHIIMDNGNSHFISFPATHDNPNYKMYLEWVEAGNTAEPVNLNLETTQE
jgi:hypothetical protein